MGGPSKGFLNPPQCSFIGKSIQIAKGNFMKKSCLGFFVVNMDWKKA